MYKHAILVVLACSAYLVLETSAQTFVAAPPTVVAAPVEVPQPYSFGYVSNDIEGSHGHEETGDGSGRVSGRYSLSLGDGRTRTVTYVADEFGYRADVVTNEPGTESNSPADTSFTSSALPGPDAAAAYESTRLGGLVLGGRA
ncbi:cuticle protein 10.9-like [Amblyomma americanum]